MREFAAKSQLAIINAILSVDDGRKMEKIRVLIADDHAIVRMGLTSLLGTSKSITVIGEAFDGEDTVRKALKLKPDVVIMDLVMPRKNGIEATVELHEKLPNVKVLILTTFSSSENIAKALKAGAFGAAMKSSSNDELIAAIRKVAKGEHFMSPDIEHLLEDEPPLPDLSPRQIEILESIARGLTNKEISAQLDISLESVKSHIKIILEKLSAASRTEAASIAQRKHLLKI